MLGPIRSKAGRWGRAPLLAEMAGRQELFDWLASHAVIAAKGRGQDPLPTAGGYLMAAFKPNWPFHPSIKNLYNRLCASASQRLGAKRDFMGDPIVVDYPDLYKACDEPAVLTVQLRTYLLATVLSLTCFMPAGLAQEGTTAAPDARQQQLEKLSRRIHSEILKLPQYSVFDTLHFAIKQDNSVVLRGYASRPTLKSSAENVVKKIEDVKQVENEIEVLPVSTNDDRIRAAVYQALYGFGPLQRYTSNRGGGARIQATSVARRAGEKRMIRQLDGMQSISS